MPETFTIKRLEWQPSGPECIVADTCFGPIYLRFAGRPQVHWWSRCVPGIVIADDVPVAKAAAQAWHDAKVKESLSPCPAISEAVEAATQLAAQAEAALADYEQLNAAARVVRGSSGRSSIHPFTITPANLRAAIDTFTTALSKLQGAT